MSMSGLSSHEQRVSVGHPVDVASGVVFTAWNDFDYPGPLPVHWRRFYQTGNLAMTPLGRGWACQFFMTLAEGDGAVRLTNEEGGEVPFDAPDGAQVSVNYAAQMELRRYRAGWAIWYWHHRQWLIFEHGSADGRYLLTRIEDQSGNALVLRHDDRRLSSIEQPRLARIFHLKYGQHDLVRDIELWVPGFNPRTVVSYEHDTLGRMTHAFNPAGAPIQYAYDEHHRLVRETNRLGGSFYFEYDAQGRCTKSWGDGRYLERTLAYDPDRRITRVTDSFGATTTFFLNPAGGVAKAVDPLGGVTEWKSLAGIRAAIDPLGYTSRRETDARGNVLSTVDPMGGEHKFTYDENDCCVRIVDPDGHTFNWGYDERSRVVAYESPLGERAAFERGPHGEILKQIDGEGRVVRRRYGDGMRWQEVADDLGHFRAEIDAWGRPVLISDPDGLRESYETDFDGRITVNRLPDGSHVSYSYNEDGRPVRFQYLNGAVWSFEYDLFGHVTRVIDPDGGTTACRYDTEGRRVVLVNQRNEELRDTYDANGRLVRRQFFDGRVEEYEYDAAARLVALRRPDGSVLRRRYDARSHVTEETLQSDPQAEEVVIGSYVYDWAGKLLKAANDAGTIEFEYDASRRLIKEIQNGVEVRYRYDRGGRMVEREIVKGKVGSVRFEYDGSGLLRAIADKHGSVQTFDYAPSGRVSKRTMRGRVEESFAYDECRRLVRQDVRYGGRSLITRSYEYDAASNVAVKKDNLRGTFRWKYDPLLQLSEASRDGKEIETIQHRPGRDIVALGATPFSYLPGSRLESAGASRFAYDANGNIRESHVNGQTTQYAHDVKGWLREVSLPDGASVRFQYDPVGRRTAKLTGDKTTRFVWSGDTLAAVMEDGEEPREFLIAGVSGRPSVQWIGDRAEHLICDALGAPQEVIDARGELVWWARYTAFGRAAEIGGDAARCWLRLPGQWEDRETRLHYNVNRYYDPAQTRYLTPDPIGLRGGANLYDYPRDPINSTDPLGLTCPNPLLVEADPQGRWEVYRHDDGSLTLQADCSRAMSNRPPGSDPVLRDTVHTGSTNKANFPEASLGKDDNVIVSEGLHRSAAAAHGAQIPRDPDNPHLGGVPNRPGWMEYAYNPTGKNDGIANDPNKVGIPLKDLQYPPGYPHKLPP
jgi:RHS repeat-associated protein